MKTMMLSVSAAVALGKIAAAYAIDVSDWDALKTGVATDGVAEITVGTDIAASSNLDTSKTSGSGTPVSRDLIVSGASSSSAPTVSGGGNNMYLRVGDGATLTLKDIAFSDFRHYQATDRNSVLASHQGGNLVLDNARLSGISNDDAQPMWGAVVGVSDKSQASIVNSVFENNNQKTSNEGVDAATGGVIHLQGQTSRHDLSKLNVLSGSTFSGNSLTATKTSAFGGAAYLEGWVGTMENNSFVGNAAKTESNAKDAFGGAISVGGANVGRGAATVENRFGGASAVVENSGVLNFNAADFTGTLNNYRRFNLTGENTLTGAFVNSGETTVAAGARASFSGGIENSRNIVNNGVLIVEGGNSFNGGTITGGIRFDGDASLENDGTIDGIEDSRFANSRGAALLNNGKIDRLSNVTVDGLFENASGAVFVENNLTATRTINDASLDFSGVAYTGTLLNRSRLSTTGDNTVAGGALKNAGLLSVGAGSLTLAGGLENTSVILNSGVLTAAGTSVNSGFISGDIVVGGVLNVADDGILRHDITGAGEMIVSRNLYMGAGSLSATGVFTVARGGMADVEDKTVTVGALRLNGTLNIDVASIAAGSSVYAGGKVVVNDGAEIGTDSVLKISIAAGMLKKGERTGELKIVDGNNVSGAFGNILSNNRYTIAAGGADGTIVVVGSASASISPSAAGIFRQDTISASAKTIDRTPEN